jgi:CheY-like chemotaxis protein
VKDQLHIVIIEDDPADLYRVTRELSQAGLTFSWKHVEKQDDFLAELHNRQPDLILSDHGLPSFDGFTALAMAQRECPHVPFIFVTGSREPGMVADMWERGAANCVYKGRLAAELAPAVQDALKEAADGASPIADGGPPDRATKLPLQKTESVQSLGDSLGLVLICTHCKRVRDWRGNWRLLDEFFLDHPQATLVRAICSECDPASELRP